MLLGIGAFNENKQQTIQQFNQLFTERQNEKFQQRYYSSDGKKVMIVGVQPNGEFGMGVYDNNGDNPELINKGQVGVMLPPANFGNVSSDDNLKIKEKDGEYKIALQDTVRLEALKSVYPVGSIYQNYTDSRDPAEIMNWNNSSWQKVDNAVIVIKEEQAEPEYKTVYAWQRLS